MGKRYCVCQSLGFVLSLSSMHQLIVSYTPQLEIRESVEQAMMNFTEKDATLNSRKTKIIWIHKVEKQFITFKLISLVIPNNYRFPWTRSMFIRFNRHL